jgi:hypothetical protein
MDETIRQTLARLTVHEFMLEILYAQYWANGTAAESEGARKEILRVMKSAYLAPDTDPRGVDDDLLILLQDAQVLAERFLEKVIERAAVIREQRSQAHDFP